MKDISGRSSGNATAKLIALLLFVLLFTLFVLQNTEVVEITFFFWRASASKVLLILGSGLAGVFIGFVLGWSAFGGRTPPPQEAGHQ